jgi:hypothetical protein
MVEMQSAIVCPAGRLPKYVNKERGMGDKMTKDTQA